MKQKNPFKNPTIKKILSALAVAFFGFIILTVAFLFDFLYQSAVRWVVRLFMPLDPSMDLYWFPMLMHGSFVVIIGLISWLVFRSKLKALYKAIFMTVPVAVVLVTLGMFTYRWPIVTYSLGGFLCLCTLYYFYHTKKPWLYYYALVLVGLALAVFTFFGKEI